MTESNAAADRQTPRVVLFGHPGAGKSALLGALLQAGETQGETLRGEVLDPTRRLAALRDREYKAAPFENTATEVVSYPVRVRPWRVGRRAVADPFAAVVFDVDGRAAGSLIRHPGSLQQWKPSGGVAAAVGEADALVLVVNAAADDDELNAAFADFTAFLQVVEHGRSFAREVGGLPVVLTLAQCDRLARPGDTAAAWLARVEKRKGYVLKRFADHLGDDDPSDGLQTPYLAFGSVDLAVAATATRRPPLADAPSPPAEPFGVAELFRDAFAGAVDHRRRVLASEARLKWTVRAALAFVGVMILALAGVAAFPPKPGDPALADRVRGYMRAEPPVAERLSDRGQPAHRRALTALRQDAGFGSLPAELQEFVEGRLQEVADYRAFRAKLAAAPAPADARSDNELSRTEERLNGELALPREGWGDTAAARLRDKFLADVEAIRAGEREWRRWYAGLTARANNPPGTDPAGLAFARDLGGDWRRRVLALLAEAEAPPFPLTQPLPGSVAVDQPRGAAVTFAVPFEFDTVFQDRWYWSAVREKLVRLRELADALGLTAGPDRPPAVLDLPDPGPGVDSARLPGTRWTTLRQAYPSPDPDYPQWRLGEFSANAQSALGPAVRRSFDAGVRHVHELVRGKLAATGAGDTPAGWRRVGESLAELPFHDWGQLLTLLARLADPAAANPVTELATFLKADRFDFDLKGFELVLPDALDGNRRAPAGMLTVTLTPAGGEPLTRTFRVDKQMSRDGFVSTYLLRPDGDGRLVYRPGDTLTADLSVRVGGQDQKLEWVSGGPDAFQFERLRRTPRLTRPGPGGVPQVEPAVGVRLTPTADSKLPALPVLLPEGR